MNRFASEVGGDGRKLRIGAALNILLKGTPLIYYGQELGMRGRQFTAWGTDANDIPVREAFEWGQTASSAGTATWYRDSGPWWTRRYSRDGDGISVEEEARDSTSLLTFYRRLLILRRERPELTAGDQRVIPTSQERVLAVLRSTATQASLLLVNLSDTAANVAVRRGELPATLARAGVEDFMSGRPARSTGSSLEVALPAFGVALLAR